MLITIIASIYLVNEAVQKYLERKTGIRISEKLSKVGEIPFPAVSICPELLIDASMFKNFTLDPQQ